jgi:hypothetical protein
MGTMNPATAGTVAGLAFDTSTGIVLTATSKPTHARRRADRNLLFNM